MGLHRGEDEKEDRKIYKEGVDKEGRKIIKETYYLIEEINLYAKNQKTFKESFS